MPSETFNQPKAINFKFCYLENVHFYYKCEEKLKTKLKIKNKCNVTFLSRSELCHPWVPWSKAVKPLWTESSWVMYTRYLRRLNLFSEGRGAMRPWTPQYPVRTQVVSRTLSEPRKRLVEPRKRLFLFKFFF